MQSPKFALLTYKAHPEYNVGDYIQSLAAAQYLPAVHKYINREKLSTYKEEKVKLIMNGWFMHVPDKWPPSSQVDPLVISFHLNSQVKEKLLTPQSVSWFNRHSPVGCRDEYTYEIMKQAGINCYLSGCLTTTLENKWNYRTDNIYFTDVLFKAGHWSTGNGITKKVKNFLSASLSSSSTRNRLMNLLFDDELLSGAKFLRHYQSAAHSEAERFGLAEDYLEKYATARLVITSRLHCALPCLAFGTPVIFINYGLMRPFDECRIKGTTELFNTINIDKDERVIANFKLPTGKINAGMHIENPPTYRKFVPRLRETCQTFVTESLPA